MRTDEHRHRTPPFGSLPDGSSLSIAAVTADHRENIPSEPARVDRRRERKRCLLSLIRRPVLRRRRRKKKRNNAQIGGQRQAYSLRTPAEPPLCRSESHPLASAIKVHGAVPMCCNRSDAYITRLLRAHVRVHLFSQGVQARGGRNERAAAQQFAASRACHQRDFGHPIVRVPSSLLVHKPMVRHHHPCMMSSQRLYCQADGRILPSYHHTSASPPRAQVFCVLFGGAAAAGESRGLRLFPRALLPLLRQCIYQC